MKIPLYQDGQIDEFLISSVRKADDGLVQKLREYKDQQALKGKKVHLPFDDTVQEDPIGFYICLQNKNAMQAAKMVGIYLDPDSTGSVFDVGMAFQAKKLVNVVNVVAGKELDDFSRFIMSYADLTQGFESYVYDNPYFKELDLFQDVCLADRREVKFVFEPKPYDKLNLAQLGMVFMEGLPVDILNIRELVPTPHKSYENVVIAMHNYFRNR